jgi:hypothetical protein
MPFVCEQIEAAAPMNAADAETQIGAWFPNPGPAAARAWKLVQRLDRIDFGIWHGGVAGLVTGSLAGRLFDAQIEVRWLRDGTGFRLWKLSGELTGGVTRGREMKYYLWGSYDKETEQFVESNLKADLTALYRAAAPEAVFRQNDRPYLKVVEYFAEPPDEGETSLERIEKRLNQPRVVAHRVWGFGFDTETAAAQAAEVKEDEE